MKGVTNGYLQKKKNDHKNKPDIRIKIEKLVQVIDRRMAEGVGASKFQSKVLMGSSTQKATPSLLIAARAGDGLGEQVRRRRHRCRGRNLHR